MTLPTFPPALEFASPMLTAINDALVEHVTFGEQCPARLTEAIHHSLLAPGKRLRPMLVLLAAEACGCHSQKAMPAACAVEMVHAYSLIHDDLPAMDDDDLRRGRPTCHVQFDEATAILAGDALLTQAFAAIAAASWSSETKTECIAALAQAAGISGMVGGQADDLSAEQHVGGDLKQLESIHARKTGAMIRVSLRLGAIIADSSKAEADALDTYGKNLGLAFQIVDDLLDYAGDEQSLGKRTQKDARRGKLTFPGLLGVEEAARRARQLIDEANAAITLFDERRGKLQSLAKYVIDRNH